MIFCVFQANRGESEASAKRDLRARGGALKTRARLALASVSPIYAKITPVLQANLEKKVTKLPPREVSSALEKNIIISKLTLMSRIEHKCCLIGTSFLAGLFDISYYFIFERIVYILVTFYQ